VGLPDRDSASTWGGKLLVDRDGTEIGTCTQIFLDDSTGLPEWAEADLSGGPGVLPLMDAAVAGDHVRVAVRREEVVDAPRVDDPLHISQDEEERLYRHYGITFSRGDSESLLPVDTESVDAEPVDREPVVGGADVAEPLVAPADLAQSTSSTSPAAGEMTQVPHDERRGLLPALAAGAVGVLASVAAAIFWWRRHRQLPPTRKELLAARARGASLALATKKDQVATSAVPLVQSGRRLSAAAASRAGEQAHVAAERAAVQARAAAQQAAAVAAAARTVRLQRVPSDATLERRHVEGTATDAHHGRDAVMSALQAFGGFAAGYAVRARTGRRQGEDSEQR
jgi:hypothetical protein